MICSTLNTHIRNLDVALNSRNALPITHIRNLDVALNGSNASPTSMTIANRPQPPTDHPILLLTAAFQLAIQENNIVELTTIYLHMRQTVITHFDFRFYDCSKLCAIHQTAMNILNSTICLATRNAAAFNLDLLNISPVAICIP